MCYSMISKPTPTQSANDKHRKLHSCEKTLNFGPFGGKPEQHMETLNRAMMDCEHCDYQTMQSDQMEVHMRSHSVEEPVESGYCSIKTTQIQSGKLSDHTKSNTGKMLYKCGHCDNRSNVMPVYYKDQRSLDRHMIVHRKTPFNCDRCDYVTWCKLSILRHVRAHPPYRCVQCGYTNSQKSVINLHINTHHKEKVVYKCIFCDFKTAREKDFRLHIKFHC